MSNATKYILIAAGVGLVAWLIYRATPIQMGSTALQNGMNGYPGTPGASGVDGAILAGSADALQALIPSDLNDGSIGDPNGVASLA